MGDILGVNDTEKVVSQLVGILHRAQPKYIAKERRGIESRTILEATMGCV